MPSCSALVSELDVRSQKGETEHGTEGWCSRVQTECLLNSSIAWLEVLLCLLAVKKTFGAQTECFSDAPSISVRVTPTEDGLKQRPQSSKGKLCMLL